MEQKQFQCTADCLNCSSAQRQYCASQHSYNAMRMVQAMQGTIDLMRSAIEEMKSEISAIKGNEDLVFDPMKAEEQAQDGEAVQKIDSPENQIKE